MAIREKGKLRDLGMVFKPSFKCLKIKKINFIQVILKLETLLYQNIYIYISVVDFVNNILFLVTLKSECYL